MTLSASGRVALLLSGMGLLLLTSCDRRLSQSLTANSPSPIVSGAPEKTAAQPAAKPQSGNAPGQQPSAYRQAIDRAAGAAVIAQSAQSRDDWQLVVNRWQQAIDLLRIVPKSSPDYAQAQRKLGEYRGYLAQAQQQFRRANLPKDPDAVIVLAPAPAPQPPAPVRPATNRAAANPVPTPAASSGSSPRAFSAPIVRRAGNTPVVRVTFNGSQPFDMILDTGASGTLITQRMAAALGVIPVSQAIVDTASEQNVAFPLGYVQSIEVGGATAQNVLVAIAGPELDVGLLGHDFFGNYDLVIKADRVEFRERSS